MSERHPGALECVRTAAPVRKGPYIFVKRCEAPVFCGWPRTRPSTSLKAEPSAAGPTLDIDVAFVKPRRRGELSLQ